MQSGQHQFNILETERLYLRRLVRDDAEFILNLLNQPSWLEFIGDKNVYSLNDAKKYIELSPMTMYQHYGFGLFLVCSKDTSTPIGLCGLMKRDNLDDADLGYAFLPDFWQKGFALEAVQSVLSYAKNTHQLTRVLALCKSSNTASIKLLNKVDFTFDRDLKLLENEENLQIYQLEL
ncbi:MAG: RimJ/RimL family protein N-acetyltransferase [Cocleimonas sp.]|jgi:RimJ/RimL family protein N-acetyltransferase